METTGLTKHQNRDGMLPFLGQPHVGHAYNVRSQHIFVDQQTCKKTFSVVVYQKKKRKKKHLLGSSSSASRTNFLTTIYGDTCIQKDSLHVEQIHHHA